MTKMDIKSKLERLIPPDDFQHRWEFSNHHLVDELDDDEKKEIEDMLIEKLHIDTGDLLIIDTLSYLNSEKATPAMRNSLEICDNKLQKIIIAASIYKITHDNATVDIAIDAFKQLHGKWDLVSVFSYLKVFEDSRINDMIKAYIDNPDFLISHNAKRALGMVD